jgi:N-acetylneuraminic acid mutarotase
MGGQQYTPFRPIPGIKGTPDNKNNPGGRKDAITWIDSNGDSWMFGGSGYTSEGLGLLNDLWKYSAATNQWTWMHGDLVVGDAGNYGTINVSASTNIPSARMASVSWINDDGDFFIFGGYGKSSTGDGLLNDLWKYDPDTNEWTWIGGSDDADVVGNYGILGNANVNNWPGGRGSVSSWKRGNFVWVYGGEGIGSVAGRGSLGDLWRYNLTNGRWTWMGGPNVIDAPVSSTHPGGRATGNSGIVINANLYLIGGSSGKSPFTTATHNYITRTYYNDVWRYNIPNETWTLLKGGSATGTSPSYGTMGVTASTNQPGRRAYGAIWKDADNNFWLSGGMGYNAENFYILNDIWRYEPATNNWTWMKGGSTGEQYYGYHYHYGEQGVSNAANIRESRAYFSGWTDATGKLWSFGGELYPGITPSFHNDLWVYDPATNISTWMKGDSSKNVNPVYGTLGVPDNDNRPGERRSMASWYDNNGNLWLYGGQKMKNQDGPSVSIQDDLWKYNISSGQWTWHGSAHGTPNDYGTMGVPSPSNSPIGRYGQKGWTDASNNLLMFGGNSHVGVFNDIWKYDPSISQWTWVKGLPSSSVSLNSGAVYGLKGVAHNNNTPGRRIPSVLWKGNDGMVWVFGGHGLTGGSNFAINDLWRYDPTNNQWTWMSGDNSFGQLGVYGMRGVADPANKPGPRTTGVSWTDTDGNLWMFGGFEQNQNGFFNDLWKYNITTGLWTWMHGSNSLNALSTSVSLGNADASNTPGARSDATAWVDAYGRFWLFGGSGFDSDATNGYLNDIWMFDPSTNQWTKVKESNGINHYGIYGTKGIVNVGNKPGSRFGAAGWIDGVGDVWIYGGEGFSENGLEKQADLWRITATSLAPLPLTFLEFNGKLINSDGLLNWKTENEQNVSSFIVERSTNGTQYFPVGTLSANNTSGRQQYQFTDPGITSLGASIIYYRLKQTDFDGKAAYSRIIALTIDKSSLVLLYPNPVSNQANVTITVDRSEKIIARVVNQSGAVVKQSTWSATSGSSSYSIDVSNLAKGIYYLSLQGETITKTFKFVKD